MVTLPISYCRRSIAGLTLVEVLVALAIVSIAMTAIIKAISQNIRSTAYLQDKTIALYVAQQVLNEARVGMLKFPLETKKMNEKTRMLGRNWYWQAKEMSTPNPRIKKIEVRVFIHAPDNKEASPVISMGSYVYHGA